MVFFDFTFKRISFFFSFLAQTHLRHPHYIILRAKCSLSAYQTRRMRTFLYNYVTLYLLIQPMKMALRCHQACMTLLKKQRDFRQWTVFSISSPTDYCSAPLPNQWGCLPSRRRKLTSQNVQIENHLSFKCNAKKCLYGAVYWVFWINFRMDLYFPQYMFCLCSDVCLQNHFCEKWLM